MAEAAGSQAVAGEQPDADLEAALHEGLAEGDEGGPIEGELDVDAIGPTRQGEAGLSGPRQLDLGLFGGGSQDAYVRSMAASAAARGWRVAVLNMRGCGGSAVVTPRLFSAHRGSTDDLRLAVAHARRRPHLAAHAPKVAAVGWSNGATILNNALAEQSSTHPPTAASAHGLDAGAVEVARARERVAPAEEAPELPQGLGADGRQGQQRHPLAIAGLECGVAIDIHQLEAGRRIQSLEALQQPLAKATTLPGEQQQMHHQSGTGSQPQGVNGWQRSNRRRVIPPPRQAPWRRIASRP
jgi:hypothetical protein